MKILSKMFNCSKRTIDEKIKQLVNCQVFKKEQMESESKKNLLKRKNKNKQKSLERGGGEQEGKGGGEGEGEGDYQVLITEPMSLPGLIIGAWMTQKPNPTSLQFSKQLAGSLAKESILSPSNNLLPVTFKHLFSCSDCPSFVIL